MLSARSLACFLLIPALLSAQAGAPERSVNGNVITSQRDPAVRIELPAAVHYVGVDRFVLYDIADCELHAFVESDATKNVKRLFWIQFEQYLPTRPDLHHTYDSPQHATIGGWDFYVDSWVRASDEPNRPGSDGEHIRELLRAKGYKLPAAMMSVRLVHLLDPEKRKELMIIYSENLAPTGLSAASLQKGGASYSRWPDIQKALIERAEKSIKIEPLSER
jgi:hypothetical protein